MEKLEIEGTPVTPHGGMVVLENLPNLKYFGYEYVVQALAHLHRRITAKESNVTVCKLTHLEFCDQFSGQIFPYVKEDFASAVSICPDLIQVKLEGLGLIVVQDLTALAKTCKTLTHLDMFWRQITTFSQVLPILQSGLIESIKLRGVSDVDVSAIVRLCPRLRYLILRECEYAISSELLPVINTKTSYENCSTQLEYIYVTGNGISADDLLLLLSSSCLIQVNCGGLGSNLNDHLLENAFKLHGFHLLECFRLYRCENVTKAAIDLLMTSKTRLRKLDVIDCPQLGTETNVEDWRTQIDRHNWQLDIFIH